ncbi:unnamed protein product [Amaranthus hypochondriacus]
METLYIKLYKKYSKLKDAKDHELDQANVEQELKFVEFMSAAENLIKHLMDENKRLSDNIDELRKDVDSLRNAKDEQYDDFQQRLMEEKQKNQKLSAEVEDLRQLQQERPHSCNGTDGLLEQNINKTQHNFSSSPGESSESSMRMTRKRARLAMETNSSLRPAPVSPQELPTTKGTNSNQQQEAPLAYSQPECCQSSINDEAPCKCLFQNFVECLTGMKVSIFNQPEGRGIHAVHQSSGYSFNLTWLNKVTWGEELLCHVTSLGTFANVAPEWMQEDIIFSTSMCSIFFERLFRFIRHR